MTGGVFAPAKYAQVSPFAPGTGKYYDYSIDKIQDLEIGLNAGRATSVAP